MDAKVTQLEVTIVDPPNDGADITRKARELGFDVSSDAPGQLTLRLPAEVHLTTGLARLFDLRAFVYGEDYGETKVAIERTLMRRPPNDAAS